MGGTFSQAFRYSPAGYPRRRPFAVILPQNSVNPDATKPPSMILLLGCTASGKSAAALELASRLDAEILSIDSMQVYRRMDIGTAKPTPAERAAVPHHLIDVAEPGELFSVSRFVELADAAIADIHARGRRVLAVAGTPLYLMGLMYGLFDGPSADEAFRAHLRARASREGTPALHAELSKFDSKAAERIHPNDLKRIERALEVFHLTGRPLSEQQVQWEAGALRYPAIVVGIRRSREDVSRRIRLRVEAMIAAGLVEEVRSLANELGEQSRQAVGYAEILTHLRGACSLGDAVERIKINTRQFAKHQRTWFRKFAMTRWIDVEPDETTASITERLWQAITECRIANSE
ncbi:MAG TPA: tRNA (adenosine(37)-N6)-dimethylallyltransferase MiaA [Phycisphaerae bacterium]|nr:tRNA (adenosine(37)-N6)-dimethylallyltransferase MiaA [Phycisphaerae bacterium]